MGKRRKSRTCKRTASGSWFKCFSDTRTPSPKTRRRSPRRSPSRTYKASPRTVLRRQHNLRSRSRNLQLLKALDKKIAKTTNSKELRNLQRIKRRLLNKVSSTRKRYQ